MKINYRYAQPDDIKTIFPLLLEVSFCTKFLYLTTYQPEKVYSVLKKDFTNDKGNSSFKNYFVAELIENSQSKIIGLVVFYDFNKHTISKTMEEKFNKESVEILRPFYDSVVPYSFYISSLIVNSNYRNLNIGVQLINHVKEKASSNHYPAVCLHVWEDNQRGINFYMKNKFSFCETITLNTSSPLLPPSKTLHLMMAQTQTQIHT